MTSVNEIRRVAVSRSGNCSVGKLTFRGEFHRQPDEGPTRTENKSELATPRPLVKVYQDGRVLIGRGNFEMRVIWIALEGLDVIILFPEHRRETDRY